MDNLNKTLKLSEIKYYKNNNKDHPEKQIELLAEIIKKYWYDDEIIVNNENVIIAGHWRLEALKKLWWNEVSVKVKSKLTKSVK